MTPRGHMATSGALGVSLATPMIESGEWLRAGVVVAAALAGARAPDALEMYRWRGGKRYSLIPHRTLTHWPPVWIIAIGATYPLTPPAYHLALTTLLLSVALHLLFDALTPSGIPLLWPFGRRTSMRLYRTGDWASEARLTLILWIAAGPPAIWAIIS